MSGQELRHRLRNLRANLGDHTGHVVAEYEGALYVKSCLNTAIRSPILELAQRLPPAETHGLVVRLSIPPREPMCAVIMIVPRGNSAARLDLCDLCRCFRPAHFAEVHRAGSQ